VKLKTLLIGWRYVVWKDKWHEIMARQRARICNDCEHAKHGKILQHVGDDIEEIQGYYCGLCDCPLSAKLRAQDSKCDANKW